MYDGKLKVSFWKAMLIIGCQSFFFLRMTSDIFKEKIRLPLIGEIGFEDDFISLAVDVEQFIKIKLFFFPECGGEFHIDLE